MDVAILWKRETTLTHCDKVTCSGGINFGQFWLKVPLDNTKLFSELRMTY